ncbi:Fatty acid desaturase [Minicystis rosea]|nr:Fatty acid desaturase [Minicystis rosea]
MENSAQPRTDRGGPNAIDVEGFARALKALRDEVEPTIGKRDVEHLERLARWGRISTALGYATAWIAPNPISAILLSTGNVTRWTMVMHHISHRALDGVPGVPERLTSRGFAQGARRFVDWLDWILPEAWHHEHDVLHHYHTGELEDPDLVEENMRMVRELDAPLAVKYGIAAFYAFTWKLTYYAPSTFQMLVAQRRRRAGLPKEEGEQRYVAAFNPLTAEGREFWRRCVLPYGLTRFVAIPALFLPLGPIAAGNVLANSVMAEALANLHSFLIIAPNHCGEDVHRFDGRAGSRAEFYVRQVLGSVNFTGGDELSDFLQGYLNYQIEHHLFPDLPPLKYREIKPRVQEICARFGVPYIEESVFTRARKLADVMVGKASMKRAPREAGAVG